MMIIPSLYAFWKDGLATAPLATRRRDWAGLSITKAAAACFLSGLGLRYFHWVEHGYAIPFSLGRLKQLNSSDYCHLQEKPSCLGNIPGARLLPLFEAAQDGVFTRK